MSPNFTLYAALLFYTAGTLIALASLFTRERRTQHAALVLMIGGFLCHTTWIGTICARTHHPPLTNLPEAAAFVAWCIFVVELALFIRYRVQAASFFVCFLLEESTRTWPSTHEALKASLGSKFVVEDEKTASFNWCLAAISLGLQGVRNTFVPEQAGKLEKWIFMSMTDWAVDEVKRYDAAFQKGFKWIFVDMNDQCRTFDKLKPEAEAAFRRENPLGGVPGRLLHRWLGNNITNCEADILGNKTGFIDAWAMLEAESALAGLAVTWNWKKIKDDFNLVPSPADNG